RDSRLAGTVDERRAGPGAGHRWKGRFARPDDHRFVAPTRLLAVPSNRGAVPANHHQNTFTSSGISFSPSHCIGVSGTSRVPSHSAKCGPLTGGSGPSASGIAIVIVEWVVFAVNVPVAVCGDDPASVHICCVNRNADVGCAVPTLVSACQPDPTVAS